MLLSVPLATHARSLNSCFLMMGTAVPSALAAPICAGRAPARGIQYSANDHVIAAQELSGGRLGALALLKRDSPIDDGVADALGLLDQAPFAAPEVRGVNRAVIEKAQLLLLVDDDVRGEPLAQDAAIRKPGDPRRQTTDLVVGLLQAHDLAIPRPSRKQINRPSAQGQVADMRAAVRDARMDVGVIEDFGDRPRVR